MSREVTHHLYEIRPRRVEMLSEGPTEQEASRVAEHFSYLSKLTDEGVVVLAGRTLDVDENGFGIVILAVGDEEEARRVMEKDPAVSGGVMSARLYPFKLSLLTGVR